MDKLVLVKRTGKDILAVKQQVDREAMQAWAKRVTPPFYPVPPMKGEKLSVGRVGAFLRGCIA